MGRKCEKMPRRADAVEERRGAQKVRTTTHHRQRRGNTRDACVAVAAEEETGAF